MKKIIVFCLVSFVFFVGSMSFAATYDAVSQFDLINNPASNGYWSYGYTETLGSGFTRFTYNDSAGWGLSHTTDYPDVEMAAGYLTLAPGNFHEYAIVRWVTPVSGQYTIAATFTGYYTGSYNGEPSVTNADINVLYNNSPLFVFDSIIINGNSFYSYGTLRALIAGDTIDFAVGDGPDTADWDRVRLTATISSVPEPATMLLLGLGLIGVAGVRRKFKK